MPQPSSYSFQFDTSGSPFATVVAALTLATSVVVASIPSASDVSVTKYFGRNSAQYVSASTVKNFSATDFKNSTAIFALLKLESLLASYPNLASNVADARTFAKSMPYDLMRPDIWTDEESEVAFEWRDGSRHAMVSFEGNGSFGYALRKGNRFVPGSFPGDLQAGIPRDLVNYLSAKA